MGAKLTSGDHLQVSHQDRAAQQLRRSSNFPHSSRPPLSAEPASAEAAQWHHVVRPVYAVDIVAARAVCNYKVRSPDLV